MGQTQIRTRTFDDLMADISVDYRILDEEGLIEPQQLIKVAQRVNYDLGLRIHQTKEIILDVKNHIAKLPEDFYILNFALMTGNHKCITPVTWAGRTTENISTPCSGTTDNSVPCSIPLTYETNQLNPNQTYNNACGLLGTENPRNSCTPEQDPWFQRSCYATCGGENNTVKVIEHKNHQVYEYTYFEKLYIKPQAYLDPGSMNSKYVGCHSVEIKNGFLYTSYPHGKIYISYQGAMEDEEGNLLVLSHPEIDFYYLAALQEYIFKILYYSNGDEVVQKYDRAKQETKEARVRALSIVNTPNFQEIQTQWRLNRESQYKRYYNTFATGAFEQFYRSLPF